MAGFAFSVLVPAALSLLLHLTKDLHGLPIEAMSLMVVVVATALIGGLAPAVLSALVSALLLNYLFTPPLYTLTIAEPENVVTIAIFVAVGIAVASVVDNAARRTAEARAARAEADALTVLAHSLLTSSDDLAGTAVVGLPALRRRRSRGARATGRRGRELRVPAGHRGGGGHVRGDRRPVHAGARRPRRCPRRSAACSTRTPPTPR